MRCQKVGPTIDCPHEILPNGEPPRLVARAPSLGYDAQRQRALPRHQGRADEAVKHFRTAAQGYRQKLGEAHPYTCMALNGLAVALKNAGPAKLPEVIAMLREVS